MDPFKGQGGIQMLLTAEQEAQHIVSNARNCKIQFFLLFLSLCSTNLWSTNTNTDNRYDTDTL